LDFELKEMSKRIASVMITLGEYPNIRHYNRPSKFSTSTEKSMSSQLAKYVQIELDAVSKADSSYPPRSRNPRPILLIVDRSIDVLAPLMHEFSYNALSMDLVGLKNGKYMDEKNTACYMDDSDEVWELVKTWHIAKVLEYIHSEVENFVGSNKAAQYEKSRGDSKYSFY
jgi:syntaxin-binding protein 1